MRFFFLSFRSALRGNLSKWGQWILLLLLPLLTFGGKSLLPAQEVSTPVQVGVVLPEKGGEDFWRLLKERDGLVVTFHPCDFEKARQQVAAGQWDCALVLPQDFAKRLARQDTLELITLLIGPGSTVYPMVRETACACAAQCISPDVAQRYLLDSGILKEEEIDAVRPRLQKTLLEQDRVLVSMETLDGRPLEPFTLADSGVSDLLVGLTAILLLIWALLTAMDLGRWLDTPFARRLRPVRRTAVLLLPRLAAATAPVLCAGALALLAAEHPLPAILALLPYLFFCGAAALLLAQYRPLWGALPALLPLVPAAGLLLSPVLLDLSLLFPALGPVIRWMPVTVYLRACGGSLPDGLMLAAGGGVCLALAWIERGSRKAAG